MFYLKKIVPLQHTRFQLWPQVGVRHFVKTMKMLPVKMLLILTFAVLPGYILAQKSDRLQLDSLIEQLHVAVNDTSKISLEIEAGSVYLRLKMDDSATFHLQHALSSSGKLKWQKGISRCYLQLGKYYFDSHKPDYTKGQSYFMQAFRISFKNKDYPSAYRTIEGLYERLLDLNKITELINILKSAAGEFEKSGQRSELARTYMLIGSSYQYGLNYSFALDYFNKGLVIEKIDHRKYLQDGQELTIVYCYMSLRNTVKARKLLLEILATYRKTKDQPNLANGYLALGATFTADGSHKAAIINYNIAARIAGTGFPYVSTSAENDIAWSYFELKDYNNAYAHAARSLKFAKTDSALIIMPLSTLASIYRDAPAPLIKKIGIKLGQQYEKALELLQQCERYAVAHGMVEFGIGVLGEISITYEKMNRPVDALKSYKSYVVRTHNADSLKDEKAIVLREAQLDFARKEDNMKYTQRVTSEQLKQKKLQSNYFLAGIGGLLTLSLFIGLNYHNQKKSNNLLSEANKEISYEKARSEELLLNILPADVAEELKEKGSANARLFDEVTVLFTDFVNFTTISELLTPQQLVDELHFCFKAFDEIMATHHIEKIKTIGDAYLAVAGLPNADVDHAVNTIRAALAIHEFIDNRIRERGDKTFNIRIGVHSGSVVAGIVGVKKFAYDIWGDTVNTAARMEQNSLPGKINLSEKTYELVKDKFEFTYRGEIEAKNKGALKMYFINT